MSGRFFDKKVVEAYIADGTEKFKKSNEKSGRVLDGYGGGDGDGSAEGAAEKQMQADAEEGRRLDRFGSWLEGEG